jgi:hypothetical protein
LINTHKDKNDIAAGKGEERLTRKKDHHPESRKSPERVQNPESRESRPVFVAELCSTQGSLPAGEERY